jgi:hypothetical protein
MKFIIVLLFTISSAQASSGSDAYTPTKIEWLVLELRASAQKYRIIEDGFSILPVAADSDTVELFVQHRAAVDRAQMNAAINTLRDRIEQRKRWRGWKWLKVREEIRQLL